MDWRIDGQEKFRISREWLDHLAQDDEGSETKANVDESIVDIEGS